MKHNFKLFNLSKNKLLILLWILGLSIPFSLMGQSYVTWTNSSWASSMSGSFTGGTVTITNTGSGNNVNLFSPADAIFAGGQGNLQVTGSQTMSTLGPSSTIPAKSITFTFSVPVTINRLNIADIDLFNGGSNDWNDRLTFSGVTFTSSNGVNCTVNNSGVVTPGTEIGQSAEYASWYTSTAAVTSFTINFPTSAQNTTTAFLGFSIQVTPSSSCMAEAGTLTY